MSIGIYKIENKINGKIYIGQSVNIERRFNEHCRRDEQQIDQAIQKYGVNNFTFSILEECEIEQLNQREDYYISKYNSIVPNGYNLGYCHSTCLGENNGASKLTDQDVVYMRNIYASRLYTSARQIWLDKFSHLISYDAFRMAFTGQKWSHIMPEVFTEENYQYYITKRCWMYNQQGENNKMSVLTDDIVMQMRQMYVEHDRKYIFSQFPMFTERVITSVISGQNWKHLPIYKKREKKWIFPQEGVK